MKLVFSPVMKVRWLTAVCQFATHSGFKGLSFNTLSLIQPTPSQGIPDRSVAVQQEGLIAIARCFLS